MPNAVPPELKALYRKKHDDLFEPKRLVSSAPPPPDEQAMEIPEPPPGVEAISPLDTTWVPAQHPRRPPWRRRGVQAVAALAVGVLVALGAAHIGDSDEEVVSSASIAPESAQRTEEPPPSASALALDLAFDLPVDFPVDAPVHIDTAEDALEIKADVPEVIRAAHHSTRHAAEQGEDTGVVDEDASPEPEALSSSAEPASMDDLIDHAVAHLDENELLTGDPEPDPEPAVEEEPTPVGPSRQEVRRVMEGLRPALRECAPTGHGLTTVQLTVTATGRATAVRVTGAFAGSPAGSCMARAARSIAFPGYEADEPVTLRYPYRF